MSALLCSYIDRYIYNDGKDPHSIIDIIRLSNTLEDISQDIVEYWGNNCGWEQTKVLGLRRIKEIEAHLMNLEFVIGQVYHSIKGVC